MSLKKIMAKKAQITFFIIIGITLLGLAVAFIYVTYAPEPEEEAEVTEAIELVPVEFRPIFSLVQQCLYDTSVMGLQELGKHGGYISLDQFGMSFNDMNPTESDGLRVFPPNHDTALPYWLYFESRNDCKTGCQCGTNQPQLYNEYGSKSIEAQMNVYIAEHLNNCLRDFMVFKAKGMDINTGEPEVDLEVRHSDIAVNLKYPITAKKGDIKSELEEFYVTIPLNLMRMYELAKGLTDLEQKYNYLERWTIQLVEAASLGIRSDSIPPTVAVTLEPGTAPVFWSKTKTKEIITNNILPSYLPLFQVWGTDNYHNRRGLYQQTTLAYESPSNSSYEDLTVNFEYLPIWPIYYSISGRGVRGEIIRPEGGFLSYFSFVGINRYYFYHDISYPVKIDIYDPYALNNQGYHFIFALESNVRDNKPLNCSGEGLDTWAPPVASLMCVEGQSCADVSIIAVDDFTNTPVDGVTILYGAGEESCILGSTAADSESGISKLSAKLPLCIGRGCGLTADKDGYFIPPLNLAVRCDDSPMCLDDNVLCDGEQLMINLSRLWNLNITIKKKPMVKGLAPIVEFPWHFKDEVRPLLPNGQALLNIIKIKDNPDEEDISVSVMVNGTNPTAETLGGLVPGRYQVDIHLLYQLPDIAGRTSVVYESVDIITDDGDIITLGPYTFNDTIIEGGAKYNLTITLEDLVKGNVTFYAISAPDYATFDSLDFNDLELSSKIEDLSQQYRSAIQPVFGGD